MVRRFLISFLWLLTFSLLLLSCRPRVEGWGVLLWSHDESDLDTGSVVPIRGESNIRDTYTVDSTLHEDQIELPKWRLSYFQKKSQADSYAYNFATYSDIFALAKSNGLPIREERNQDARRLYKLREGQIVKIINRDSERSTAGEYEDFWYEVLTGDGIRGFTFGFNLDIKSAAALAVEEERIEADLFLERFLNSNYRPAFFWDMLKYNRIVLERFSSDYGVFPEPDSGTIDIVLPTYQASLKYTNISKPREDAYAFEGATLILTVHSERWINLQFTFEGVEYAEDFVFIEEDIDLLALAEQERRREVYAGFLEKGNHLESAAYGTIKLLDSGRFEWGNNERLVPDIVPREAGKRGSLIFPLFLKGEIAESYDGALTFLFEGRDGSEETDMENDSEENGGSFQEPEIIREVATIASVSFLYILQNDGVRFVYLSPEMIEDNLVEEEGESPIIIYFSFQSAPS